MTRRYDVDRLLASDYASERVVGAVVLYLRAVRLGILLGIGVMALIVGVAAVTGGLR